VGDYKVGTEWEIFQANGYTVSVDIDRDQLDGYSTFSVAANQSDGTTGSGEGIVRGRDFHMRIQWNNNTAGVYNGTFGLDGSITGVAFDELHPDNVTTWRSSQQFKQAKG